MAGGEIGVWRGTRVCVQRGESERERERERGRAKGGGWCTRVDRRTWCHGASRARGERRDGVARARVCTGLHKGMGWHVCACNGALSARCLPVRVQRARLCLAASTCRLCAPRSADLPPRPSSRHPPAAWCERHAVFGQWTLPLLPDAAEEKLRFSERAAEQSEVETRAFRPEQKWHNRTMARPRCGLGRAQHSTEPTCDLVRAPPSCLLRAVQDVAPNSSSVTDLTS